MDREGRIEVFSNFESVDEILQYDYSNDKCLDILPHLKDESLTPSFRSKYFLGIALSHLQRT